MDRKPAREAPSLYVFYRSARLEARIECYDVRCFKKLKNLEGGLCTLMFVSKTRGGKHDATSAIPSDTVLIVGGDDREAGSLGELLTEEGLKATICPSLETLIASVTDGAGAALIAEEALTQTSVSLLSEVLAAQPSWSDVPLLLISEDCETANASQSRLQLASIGNVTFIERPIRRTSLLRVVRTALRVRSRQYRIEEQLASQQVLMDTLRESEAKLKFALDAAQLGAWELHLPDRKLESSEQCRRNFGLRPDSPFSYSHFASLIHPEDRDLVLQSLEDAFASRTAHRTEYRVIDPDGDIRWIWATGRPGYMPDGTPTKMVGVTLDITEHRQGERAVRESEAQLRALANSMPQLAWMANNDGHLFWYNTRWYEYTGTTFDDMQGWGWQSVHDPAILPDVLERWTACIASGRNFEMEFPLRNASGQFRWFLTQSRPVFNPQGKVVRWFGTNTDIDDKKRAEKALRESDELARSVIQNSPDCVEVLDRSGKTVLVNNAGCRVLGISEGSVQQVAWLDAWQGKDRGKAARALETALHGKTATFQDSCRAGGNENRRWEVSVTPIADQQGHVSKLLCISRDITQRLRAEEELRQTAKLESLGIMAGGIAHDFNNLLTGIMGNASLLAELSNPSDRQLAEDIVAASQRAADLTRQMLAYSGKGRFEVRPINLSGQVREILRLVMPMIDKAVVIELNLAENLPCVDADPGQMQQLIMNLVINAAEAMEGSSGRVIVTTHDAEVDDAFIAGILAPYEVAPGLYVCLEVQDTGCGMSEETKSKIFDPFFTTKFTGRGLGLAAVSGIVRGHMGAMRVYSTPGEGTTFKIFLPALAVAKVRNPAQTEIEREKGRGTVLLVDDEEIVRRIGRACLERTGYQVLLASDGKEALDVFQALSRDILLVVLDMTMPVMGGEEALTKLREIRPDIPVVVCSGHNEVEVIRRFTSHGIAEFLQKPYTAEALARAVKSALETKHGMQSTFRG